MEPNGQSVNVPGMGQMSADQFRQWLQSNPMGYGGVTPSSSSSGGSSNSSSSTKNDTNLGSNTNSGSTYNAGNFGFALNGGPDQGTGSPARTENVYALRSNDDPTSWARRVFAQGTADFGPSTMNPYISQNPNANGPFQQWFQGHYGTTAPTNALVASELQGNAPTAENMKNTMNLGMQGGGVGAPANMAGAKQNLQGIQGMLNQYGQPNHGGLNTAQNLFAGQLQNDPQLASQIMTSQLQGVTGGWGMGYLGNSLSNLATQYYNDPANSGPQGPNGSYFNQALKLVGMA